MRYLFLLIAFGPIFLSAQTLEADSLNVKTSLSLTGFWQRGNVQTSIFRGKSVLHLRPSKNLVFETTNSYVYQGFGLQKADEDILSLNFIAFKPEARVYPVLLGFFSSNFRREIDSRYLLGAGATVQVLRKPNHKLKFSLTGEYEETLFGSSSFNYIEFDGSRNISTFRSTIWIKGSYKVPSGKMIFTHESYFQPSISQKRNFRYRTDLGLEFPIWKSVNFKVNYLDTFESLVIVNQEQDDKVLTFGISIKNF